MPDAGRDIARLDEISRELADFGPRYEAAVRTSIQREFAYRRAEAAALLKAQGKNREERQAHAVQSLVDEGWFDARAEAEAERRAMEARFKVWESEKTALQTKLKVEMVELGAG